MEKTYIDLDNVNLSLSMIENIPSSNTVNDPTVKRAMLKFFYSERINIIEKTAIDTDPYLYNYILRGVTEGLSYTYLKTRLKIPCGKDMYYDRYRRFFRLLDSYREQVKESR